MGGGGCSAKEEAQNGFAENGLRRSHPSRLSAFAFTQGHRVVLLNKLPLSL